MIDSLIDALFGCRHQRTTFPLTPARKAGSGPSETYVVCLGCGKQFTYDWEQMCLAKPADLSSKSDAANLDAKTVTFGVKSKLRYLAWASVVPAAWLIANAALRAKGRSRSEDTGGAQRPVTVKKNPRQGG